MTAVLSFHKYKYFPYEKVLARREASQLLGSEVLREHDDHIEILGGSVNRQALRLVYFARAGQGGKSIETLQARLERAGRATHNRQSTRYSVHGLHEYKGKFNPQIVKAILNMVSIQEDARVLDPFCGSGTTLVECAHMRADALGLDLNPFAAFLANAKLQALGTPADDLEEVAARLHASLSLSKVRQPPKARGAREDYLQQWFAPAQMGAIELVRERIDRYAGALAPIFLAIASNLLRDYSLQEPYDLRIRRRKTPLPERPFTEAFAEATDIFVGKLRDSQMILGVPPVRAKAVLHDTSADGTLAGRKFDAAITSPPYAMALPYIDTQRLSLVWLGLAPPGNIQRLEADLIGSRETRGGSRRQLDELVSTNGSNLPEQEAALCRKLAASLAPTDGFRRRAVPSLLYRYFQSMASSFRFVRRQMKRDAAYALVVGHNHTTLGGKRYDIDTPKHLASLAVQAGWKLDELLPLQTYQRYGLNMENAVAAETLVLLRRA